MGAASKRAVFTLSVCIMAVLNFTASAQQWIPNFKHYGIRDGFPSSEVYQITSDPQKNLWFVSDRGVVKYDGSAFRVFDKKDSLPDNSVIKVYKDWKERIWLISFTGLLSYYENSKITPYKYNNIISSRLGIRVLASIVVDEHETVTLNSLDGRISTIDSLGNFAGDLYRSDTATFTIVDTGRVATFYAAQNVMSPTRFRIKRLHKTDEFMINEVITYKHFATTKLRNGDLIFYCGHLLLRIHPDGSNEVTHLETSVLNVFEDSKSNLWVGCYHRGVYVYDSLMHTVSSHYLTDFSVSHVYADYEGGIWLSTLENGIFYLPSTDNMSFATDGKIFREKIMALQYISDSVMVFATAKGQLYKINTVSRTVDMIDLKMITGKDIEAIYSLYYLKSKNRLVVGIGLANEAGLDKTHMTHINGLDLMLTYTATRFIAEDDHHLLGSAYQFVYSLDTDIRSLRFLNNTSFHSTALFKDSRGRLLAGALDGLYAYNDSNFVLLDSTKSILRYRVTDINELNKYLLIATRSNGIILLTDTSTTTITNADGLSSDNINRLSVEGNTIWASTNRGLNKIIVTGYGPLSHRIEVYNISTGLPSDEINDFAIVNNTFYAATNEGLALIKESIQNDASGEMPLYISSVKINDQDTAVLKSYSLDHTQNTFNIKFAAVSFKQSKNLNYLYRLQGQDTTWRSTTNRDVQFTNLPPGNYKFQLLAQSGTNLFSTLPVEIDFNISPPFYQSIWFKLIAAFMFWLILFTVVSLRISSIKKKAEARSALNKKFSELNLNTLRSQMNPHFTFNVLNSIQYYIAKKDSESAQLYITKFSRLIRMILDQSRNEFISLAEEIKMLTLYIELEELRFEKKFSYTIRAEQILNTSTILIPGMLIQPFVENSIRHGIKFKKGDARVDIKFAAHDSLLVCTIIDNGVGRKEAAKLKEQDVEYKSIGTAIVDERMQALSILFDGKLKNHVSDLIDGKGNAAGTCVTIEIPFKTMTV